MILQSIQFEKLHPLLVHLPIGILLFALLLEIYYWKYPKYEQKQIALLALGAAGISALFSLITGWFLGDNGGYDEITLNQHKWVAVAFTVVVLLLFYLRFVAANWSKKVYLPLFFICLVLLGVTGHIGGNMTHGEDFLFVDNSKSEKIIVNVDEALTYVDLVKPILEEKCVSCHSKNKPKGGLILSSKESILLGGDSGPLLDSVSNKAPVFLQRLHLPLKDKEHMPPKGKEQLSEEELALLKWWLDHNHCFDCKTKSLEKSKEMYVVLNSFEKDTSALAQLSRNLDLVPENWLQELNNNGIKIASLANDNPLLLVNFSGKKNITKKDFTDLSSYSEHIVELNMANSNFNDSLAPLLKEFKNLNKLQLQQTKITNKTLFELEKNKLLSSLNLYNTNIDNEGLEKIETFSNLKQLYLWQTAIDEVSIEGYIKRNPQVNLGHIKQDVFAPSEFEAPVFVSTDRIFTDSVTVSLESVFDDAKIFYTINGKIPDSTDITYVDPLLLKSATNIKAIAYKENWGSSEVSTAVFKKIKFDYKEINVNPKPSDKYSGQGAKTLLDKRRGTTNFVDGNWLGYEGKHMTLIVELKDVNAISSVAISCISAPGNWIFYPAGAQIWTSLDGIKYTHNTTVDFEKEKPSSAVIQRFFDVEIKPLKAKYVKVRVKSPLKNPDWHAEPGKKSWIFLDEIILN